MGDDLAPFQRFMHERLNATLEDYLARPARDARRNKPAATGPAGRVNTRTMKPALPLPAESVMAATP